MVNIAAYQRACTLSNMGAELLRRGNFRCAHESFVSALTVLKQSFQLSAELFGGSVGEEAIHRAETALTEESICDATYLVESIQEDQDEMPSSVFDHQIITQCDCFVAHPFIIALEKKLERADFHCSTMLYNLALSKLCLYVSTSKRKYVSDGIHLLMLALEQLGNVERTNAANDEGGSSSTSMVSLCTLVLSNLAWALTLASAQREAQAIMERLSLIQCNFFKDDYNDIDRLFRCEAAPAA